MNKRNPRYHGHRFPPEIISFSIWAYNRFSLSFWNIEDLLAERGVIVSYESIRRWCLKFGPQFRPKLRNREPRLGDQWYVDEVFVKINGETQYLWRAVDQDGDVLDVLVQRRRNTHAAKRFFSKILKRQGESPRKLITDKLRSYRVALRDILPETFHDTSQYANNRAELSHQPTRHRERQMRRLKSQNQAQRFLSLHGHAANLFRYGRHLLCAENYRVFRERAFDTWRQVTCV